jgi:hypothetical protein
LKLAGPEADAPRAPPPIVENRRGWQASGLQRREGDVGLPILKYNDNEQEHRGFGDTLGQTQGQIIKGTLTQATAHAYYAGHELKTAGETWNPGEFHLKKDCTGSGKTPNGRSQNRIIVRIDANGALVEGWAVAWRHDDRLLKLDDGFFKRAKTMRDYITK